MIVTHILADGRIVDDIEGKVIKQADFPSLYERLKNYGNHRNVLKSFNDKSGLDRQISV